MEVPQQFMQQLRQLSAKDGRYSPEAYLFVFQALEHASRRLKGGEETAHVTGKELLYSVRQIGAEEYGYLARTVFETWGIRTTRDFGEVVFNLVNAGFMGKNDQDSIEDFDGVFDLEDEFEKDFKVDWEKTGK